MSERAHHYHVFETAMGFCAIAWSDAGVARFQLPPKTADAAERLLRRRAVGAEPAWAEAAPPPGHPRGVVGPHGHGQGDELGAKEPRRPRHTHLGRHGHAH